MQGNAKILVIEDDKDINRTLEIHLSSQGYDVIKSFDGEDGLNKAKTQGPDLIVLDLRLPKLAGEALCRELKWSLEYREIPVIMFTAKNTEVDRIVGRVIGADIYLTKPCDLNILTEKVLALLKKRMNMHKGHSSGVIGDRTTHRPQVL